MNNPTSKTLTFPNDFAASGEVPQQNYSSETMRRIDFLLAMRAEYDIQGWDWPRPWQEELMRLGMIAYTEREVTR